MGRILYHYSDYIALTGIITKAEMRVNNILNMNDLSEMSYFLKHVSDEIIEMMGPAPNEKIIEKMNETAEYYMSRRFQYSAYAACFSLYEDDAAQWARYGNQGRGVCIGFDEDMLKKIIVPGMTLENVYYDADQKSHELASEFLSFIRENETAILDESISDELMERYGGMLRKTLLCSAAYKHPSFACENEVRMLFWPELTYIEGMKPGYHITAERIKKYYPLNLRQLCARAGVGFEDLFVSIKVGPESTQSPEILADYFCSMGMSEIAGKTVRSDCPIKSALRG